MFATPVASDVAWVKWDSFGDGSGGDEIGSVRSVTANLDVFGVGDVRERSVTQRAGSGAAKFLGNLSTNKYDPNSISNPYGQFGSRYGDNLLNPYSEYGSPYSSRSWRNPYATATPKIYSADGTYLGKLSSNRYDPESISNPYGQYGSPYGNNIVNPYSHYRNPYSSLSWQTSFPADSTTLAFRRVGISGERSVSGVASGNADGLLRGGVSINIHPRKTGNVRPGTAKHIKDLRPSPNTLSWTIDIPGDEK